MRASEAAGLHWNQVDIAHRVIYFSDTKNKDPRSRPRQSKFGKKNEGTNFYREGEHKLKSLLSAMENAEKAGQSLETLDIRTHSSKPSFVSRQNPSDEGWFFRGQGNAKSSGCEPHIDVRHL
jgi:hypothetical protein